MKKIGFVLGLMFLVCIFTGCATMPKQASDLSMETEKSGVISAKGQSILIYGIGQNDPTTGYYNTLADRKKVTIENATAKSKKQLKAIVEKLFDMTSEKYNDKYPDKQISDDTLASWKKGAVEKALNESKIIFTYAQAYSAVYMATSEINIADLSLPKEMSDIFVSGAEWLVKPRGAEQKLFAEYQQTGKAIDGNKEQEEEEAAASADQEKQEASESPAPTTAAEDTGGEEPFWVQDNTGNLANGIISVNNNEVIVYGTAVAAARRASLDKCNKAAMEQTGKCIDVIIDKTISEYLNQNSSEQSACDAVRAASKDISADAAANAQINGNYTSKHQVLFSTVLIYHSIASYKVDISLLKMPPEMKNIFISTAKDMLSPSAKDYVALIEGKSGSGAAQAFNAGAGSAAEQPSAQQKIKIIMNDNTIVSGTIAMQNDSQVFLQMQGDKAQIVKKSDIKAAFDPDTGKEIDFSSQSQNSTDNTNSK